MSSKKRRKTPSERVTTLAATYRCGHCPSDPPVLRELAPGIYRMTVGHDESCPVLNGTVSDIPDVFRAAS